MHITLSADKRRAAAALMALAAASLPIINILNIIRSTGADTLSDDYLVHLRNIAPILNGSFSPGNFLHNSFYRGHLMVFPTLLRIILARLTYWNAYVELFIGVGAAILTLFLIHNALTAHSRHQVRLWMWPALSVLIFSVSQVDQFTYGDASIPIGFSALGISFALWSMVRFGRSWTAVSLAIAGSWFACWSWGEGVAAWPLIIGAMVMVNLHERGLFDRFRRNATVTNLHSRRSGYSRLQFAVVTVIGLIALLPYLIFMAVAPTGDIGHVGNLASPIYILSFLGWPFMNGTAMSSSPAPLAYAIGLAGSASAGVCIYFIAKHKQPILWRTAGPSCFLISWSMLNIWQISLFRTTITPWYTGIAMLFWLGMIGLAYTLAVAGSQSIHRPKRMTFYGAAILLALLIASGVFYSNRTIDDKIDHLFSRAPASASCIHAQQVAPTLCQQRVILGAVPGAQLLYEYAKLLKPFNLSVFAPNQRWTLQGDFALDTVRTTEAPGAGRIGWLEDQTQRPLPWYDYRHLNLLLPSPDAIFWTFYLPRTAQQATLRTAVYLSPTSAAAVSRLVAGAPAEVLWSMPATGWQPVEVNLLPYAGQTVTLAFSAAPAGSGDGQGALFRYPHIDLLFDADPALAAETQRVASEQPTPASGDAVFDVQNRDMWAAQGLAQNQTDTPTWTIQGNAAALDYTGPLSLCLANYTYVVVRMSATPDVVPRVLQWSLQLNGAPSPNGGPTAPIPLLGDGEIHAYTYALRLLELKQDARLSGFRLAFAGLLDSSAPRQIRIEDVRLLGYHPGAYCQ